MRNLCKGSGVGKNPKILMIEDDLDAAEMLSLYLSEECFETEVIDNALTGVSKIKNYPYDILLLDINLPDYSGFDVCTKIRSFSSIPIIVISAETDMEVKLKAFKLGADDFILKPFDARELVARIWSLLKRTSAIMIEEESVTKTSEFRIDKVSNQVFVSEQRIELTFLEFEILSELIENRNCTVTREQLVEKISSKSSSRSLDYHIKNIRKKIGDCSKTPKYLKTEYGIGYKLIF